MLNSHQFWLTKKTVERKFGSKEDKYIISSDAELDSKIEMFKSIDMSSTELIKIIDQYQERLSILSEEERAFSSFLNEVGKCSKTIAQSIAKTSQAISYSGQLRMCLRVPLIRFRHEVCVFRQQAVLDTKATIQIMEKDRTEYRATLSWMKSGSGELDPDTGRGMEEFRTAQFHVREAKKNFDSISMDTIQKIDLLAASRYNMYSQALVYYMSELKVFAQKTANTCRTLSICLKAMPKYDFCVLRELRGDDSSALSSDSAPSSPGASGSLPDEDQKLILVDDDSDNESKDVMPTAMDDSITETDQKDNQTILTKLWSKVFSSKISDENYHGNNLLPSTASVSETTSIQAMDKQNRNTTAAQSQRIWMNLFADIDPLANPDAFNLKLCNGGENFQET